MRKHGNCARVRGRDVSAVGGVGGLGSRFYAEKNMLKFRNTAGIVG